MNRAQYFRSLATELDALRTRVRELRTEQHSLSDGEWKESVVRSILRRHLPATVRVSRGFIASVEHESTQIDVLIHDAAWPVLFQDGDFVVVTPDAVRGVIEVKTAVTSTRFRDAVDQLAVNIAAVREHSGHPAFAGLFAYDTTATAEGMLSTLRDEAASYDQRVDFAACGPDIFLKYWDLDPEEQRRFHRQWHAYNLPLMAAGYFVHNVIESITPGSVSQNVDLWFPPEGKEPHKVGAIPALWAGR